MASVEEKSEGSGASLLKKEWSQVRDMIRKEREAFRAEREQDDAALCVERSEAAAAQKRLWVETENLRASMEQLQRRVEGQSSFARGERFAGLWSVGGLEGQLLDFGPATLDPTLWVGEIPPNHRPDWYLQQSLFPVSCKTFAGRRLCRRSGPGAGMWIQLPESMEHV